MRPLDQAAEPIKIDTKTILIGSFAFAVAFFIVGSIFRHYVWVSGVL